MARPDAALGVHEGRQRLQRALYFSIGIAGIIYAGILVGGVMDQQDALQGWYWYATVLVGFLAPISLIAIAWVRPIRFVNGYAAGIALSFTVLHLLFVPMMTVSAITSSPWLQGIHALHATIAGVVWQRRWVWLYALIQAPLVGIVRYLAVDGNGDTAAIERDGKTALLDGIGGMVFSGILMGVAVALVLAGDRQDQALAVARDRAAREASERSAARAQSRINAIVHDDIMSVLLAASRGGPRDDLRAQAREALESVAALAVTDRREEPYTPAECVTLLRASVSEVGVPVDIDATATEGGLIPADAVDAVSQALEEALRNSVRHAAGDTDREVVRVVSIAASANSIKATVADNGVGFTMRKVPQRRLGIRVSILERLSMVDGGTARIKSRPGHGTAVEISWSRS